MIRTSYSYEVRSRDDMLLVKLLGEIDHHGAVSLREDIDALLVRERPHRLVVELSGVRFMDSAGLGLLMGRYRLMQQLGGKMVLFNPNGAVMKILQLAGMERFMEIETVSKGERL